MDVLKKIFKSLTLTTETKKTKSKITRKTHKKTKDSTKKISSKDISKSKSKSKSKNIIKRKLVGGTINEDRRKYYIFPLDDYGSPINPVTINGTLYELQTSWAFFDEHGHRYYTLTPMRYIPNNNSPEGQRLVPIAPEITPENIIKLYKVGRRFYKSLNNAHANSIRNRHRDSYPQIYP